MAKNSSRRGYAGWTILVSPQGEARMVLVPPRKKTKVWVSGSYQEGVEIKYSWADKGVCAWDLFETQAEAEEASKKFRRLLSAGWRVVANPGSEAEAKKVLEEWKKETDQVNGSTQRGDQSHGGQHSSGEVDHEAETASEKQRQGRGNRGGRSGGDPRKRRKNREKKKPIRARRTGFGSSPIYSPKPVQANPEILRSAEESAELLGKLVGRSHLKVRRGITVDTERLLVALETGDNPLPALEAPDESPRLKVLVTPDCSGSTQSWSGLGIAWAQHLAELPETDVLYIENSNGWPIDVAEEDMQEAVEDVDLVIYLGDGDGYDNCMSWAQDGATVVALDSFRATWEDPRLKESRRIGEGLYFRVDQVSAKAPATWTEAIRLCLSK